MHYIFKKIYPQTTNSIQILLCGIIKNAFLSTIVASVGYSNGLYHWLTNVVNASLISCTLYAKCVQGIHKIFFSKANTSKYGNLSS